MPGGLSSLTPTNQDMANKMKTKVILAILALFYSVLPATYANSSTDGIDAVAKLAIGLQDYILGKPLITDQINKAQDNLLDNSYEGTYRFQDGSLLIVAAKNNDMVLAIRKQYDSATGDNFRSILVDLMNDFGEPTTMAHEKIVYWAYGKNGKISQEQYKDAKDTGKLDSILTVKLNSSEEFDPIIAGDKKEADVYLLISSETILKQFVN